jgi:hypothetical protein
VYSSANAKSIKIDNVIIIIKFVISKNGLIFIP